MMKAPYLKRIKNIIKDENNKKIKCANGQQESERKYCPHEKVTIGVGLTETLLLYLACYFFTDKLISQGTNQWIAATAEQDNESILNLFRCSV